MGEIENEKRKGKQMHCGNTGNARMGTEPKYSRSSQLGPVI